MPFVNLIIFYNSTRVIYGIHIVLLAYQHFNIISNKITLLMLMKIIFYNKYSAI